MYLILSKILPLFVLPVGLAMSLAVLSLTLLLIGWRKSSIFFQSLTVLILWVSSAPIVAETLMGRLESAYPPLPLEKIPTSKCVVVLGGAVAPPGFPRLELELTETSDRVYKSAQLYRNGKTERVIIAAGNHPLSKYATAEAEYIAELLGQWGVPQSAIRLDSNSRNTRENALNTKDMILDESCGLPLLVTSAAHMHRAVATFRALNIEVVPVSTDVRVMKSHQFNLIDLLPSSEALNMTSSAIREYLGLWTYKFRGWS